MRQGFYVTVKDAGKTGWLLGPYPDHPAALRRVPDGRRIAEQASAWAAFYTYGTSRRVADRLPDGVANSRLPEDAQAEFGSAEVDGEAGHECDPECGAEESP